MRKSLLLFILIVLSGNLALKAQYCITNLHQNACGANGTAFIDTLYATRQGFAPALAKACLSNSAYVNRLTDTLKVTEGDTVNFRFRTLGPVNISGWIDYNGNQVFEASEWFDLTRGIQPNILGSATAIIPFGTTRTATRMRIRTRALPSQNEAADACLQFRSGLTFDFTVAITQGRGCSGTLFPPLVLQDKDKICPNDSAVVQLGSLVNAANIAYQWQGSTNGFQFTNITNANKTRYAVRYNSMSSDSIFLRLRQVCQNSADTSYSVIIALRKELPSLCYCRANLNTNPCDPAYLPDSFRIDGQFFEPLLPQTCTNTNYFTYSQALGDAPTFQQGGLFNVSLRGGQGVNISASLFIDYNQNGIFEPSEWSDLGRDIAPRTKSVMQLYIPASAQLGVTGMRLRTRGVGQGAVNGATDACLSMLSGQTYDFKAFIEPGNGCFLTTANQTILADTDKICPFDSTAIKIQDVPLGSGVDITWETSTDGINFTADPTRKDPVYVVAGSRMTTDSLWVRLKISCITAGQITTTYPLIIQRKPKEECYCTDNLNRQVCGQFISYFTILNSTLRTRYNTCPNGLVYNRFLAQDSTTTNLIQGNVYVANHTIGGGGQVNFSTWIDFNQNGRFDNNEFFDLGRQVNANVLGRGNINIPLNAKTGLTYMRLRIRNSQGANGTGDACTLFNSGVTYDFPVTILSRSVNLAKNGQQNRFQLVPNPTNGEFRLFMDEGLLQTATISVSNALGQMVYNGKVATIGQIDSGSAALPKLLLPGVYIVKISTETESFTDRLVVE